MKKLSRLVIVGFSIALLGLVLSPAADARGPSHIKLAEHGWMCITTGPNNWVHCFPPGNSASDVTTTVRVFDTTDLEEDGDLLGTELLIHDRVFHGQPCPQDGGSYLPVLGTPYMACHRFATDHDD